MNIHKYIEIIRISSIIGTVIIALLLIKAWDERHSSKQIDTSVVTILTPTLTEEIYTNQEKIPKYFRLENNLLRVLISREGANIKESSLKTIKKELKKSHPYTLLSESPLYITHSGVVGLDTSKTTFRLLKQQKGMLIFTATQDGIEITKTFNLNKDSYNIEHLITLKNISNTPKNIEVFSQIVHDRTPPPSSDGLGLKPFFGGAITTPDTSYEKYTLDDIEEQDVLKKSPRGWVAFSQHYFATAWISDEPVIYHLQKAQNGNFILGLRAPTITLQPSAVHTKTLQLYTGPKIQEELEKAAPNLELLTDYSWLWWLSQPLLWVLKNIEQWVHNWGIAIILLTLIIKIMFYRLSEKSYRSIANMKKIQPEITTLREKYKKDPAQLNQKMMQMYKDKKINPLGGCLPMLVQMPVFLALYWVLSESVELRHAPFFFWIEDLSRKDPLFILPIIMGITMFIQQSFNPQPLDPSQAKIMKMLPAIFTFLFLWFHRD